MRRVFCSDIPEVGGQAVLESREQEHLFKVLRARAGEEFGLLDGCGTTAVGVVGSDRKLQVVSREVVPEPQQKLHLCCAMPKKQKLDQLLKQAAELGAWSIRPVRCTYSVAEGGSRERWDLLLREACKQSGNPFLPKIMSEEKLPAVLDRLEQENINIYYGSVADADSGGRIAGDKAVMIGPEGGFSQEELTMLEKKAQPLNLGPFVLRLETAAVCALAVLRKMSLFLIACCALMFAAGCGGSESEELLKMGNTELENNDAGKARDLFRKAIAVNPDDPNCYLALAKVCDEKLNEPLEALYAYEMYSKTLPKADIEGRKTAEAAIAKLQAKVVSNLAGTPPENNENAILREDNKRLRASNELLKGQLKRQISENNKLKQALRGRR